MVNSIDVIIDILDKNGICTYREISDRTRYQYSLEGNEVNRSINFLCSHKIVDRERIKNPYGTKYSFYYLPDTSSTRRRRILSYKLDLLTEHSKHTKTIGLFGPNLPVRFGPYGKKNVSIYKGHNCQYSPCINVHKGQVPDCLYPKNQNKALLT